PRYAFATFAQTCVVIRHCDPCVLDVTRRTDGDIDEDWYAAWAFLDVYRSWASSSRRQPEGGRRRRWSYRSSTYHWDCHRMRERCASRQHFTSGDYYDGFPSRQCGGGRSEHAANRKGAANEDANCRGHVPRTGTVHASPNDTRGGTPTP